MWGSKTRGNSPSISIRLRQLACASHMTKPEFCRPVAYELFESQLPTIDSLSSLLLAAIAISMHALDDVTPEVELKQLRALADRVRSRVQSNDPQTLVAHLHDVLFEEEGFTGNTEHYYNPLNSYLPAVLESKRGIPITLTLVYKAVAEYVGLHVEGVNAPAHFLARIHVGHDIMLVDPFWSGRCLTLEEVYARLDEVAQRPVPRLPGALPTATHREWLTRMLANLRAIFTETGRRDDLAAMNELQALLERFPSA